MAIPATPTNFVVQTGDGSVFLSWDITPTATSYIVQRSLDGVSFATIATLTGATFYNSYLDATPVSATLYYYQVAAGNISGNSAYTSAVNIVPAPVGQVSLQWVRLQAQLRSDQFNSQFVSLSEWNSYITNSYKELYDLLAQKFGDDYFVATPYTYTTAGNQNLYPLPADFYKLLGVEIALNPADSTSWVSLRKFEFLERNRWNFPNVYTFYGITNMRYRVNGNNLMIMPSNQGGQTVRIWYAPRPRVLMRDTDLLDGISGWDEYVIVDAAIKACVKEESDASSLYQQKLALKQRIEEAAENRDIGNPEVVSDSRSQNGGWVDGGGWYGGGGVS